MKSKLLKSILLLMVFAIGIQLQAQTQSPQTALSYDGVNDYVSGATGISTSLTAITIEAWVYHNTLPAGVVQRYVTISPEVAVLRYDGSASGGTNELHFYIKKSNGSIYGLRVDNVLTTGTWMHIAGTYDGTTMKLYLNGNLIGSSSPAGGLYPPSGGYSFSSGGSEAFNGKMDEVSVWNYARAMADIREDMYRTAPIANANLLNYWQFNNGSGTTLTDMKGTANGTLNNMDNSNWIASTIPFAAGAVNTQIVNATGTKTFTGTGLVANFTAKSGTDTIVASRIDTLPNVSPTGVPTVFNSQYWVVKRFGTGTFTSNLTFTLSEDLTATDESLPANISLYARANNSDASWTSLATATSVNAANNTATFNGISGFSQFIVVRNCTPPTITSQSTASQTQPENCSFYPITVTATGTNLTYQWYSTTVASNINGASLGTGNGAQTSSYTPPGKVAGTLYYYCVVSGCGPSQTTAVSGALISTAVAAPAGSGTVADPYRIASLDNLCWLQAWANDENVDTSNIIQTADINAAPCRNWNGGKGFTPIGGTTPLDRFKGTYNGKGHSVDSIYINYGNTAYGAGFFGILDDARIDSLNLTNVSITGYEKTGALAGYMVNNTTVNHCSSSGIVSKPSDVSGYIGGLIGLVSAGSSIIQYCYSSTEVNDNYTGATYSGGLIGKNEGGTITQCYARGLVSSGGTYVGGFVGLSVHADQCYWDNQASGQTSGGNQSGSGTWNLYGKSTAEMKTQSTYTGWDFSNRWYISANANNGYPCFYYAPELSTQAVTNIQTFTATANGTIERRGTHTITSYGVCYNTTGTPTTADSKVNLGAAPYYGGAFSANMSGLHHSTTYYVRAFAINEHETVYGEQQSFTTTNVTQASTCLFNGDQANHISIPNNSSLQLTNNYTIEVWLKPGVAVSTNRIIVSKGYNANGYTLLTSGSGNQRGLIFDGMATADNILTQNQWCHVAAVNDNGTRHLYLNGVDMPLTGTPASVTANTQPLYLTNYYNGDVLVNNLFRGYVEEVRLWNTAMTFAQIRENMHLPLTGSETGLVSNWQFDEGQPPSVYDKKGVNNGTWYATAINQYRNSTIPFGSGYSNTQVVSTTGTTTFTNTGLAINFTTKSGSDIIVVARIDSFPNVNPANVDTVFDRQYWTVHKYGLGDYTANLTFTINEDLTASDELQPGKIDLYTRTNATDDNWTYLASATSVSATNHQVTFNGLNNIMNPSENDPNSVKYLGQYIIVREQCQVNIPDVNFKTALLAIPGLDANSDGKIQCTEAIAFTGDIDVNAKTIADMTGIEAFSNITKLYCSNNNLTSINISALTLLTDLDCSNNQLTALNISSNTALINFLCANNSLTSLNVSGNTSLNYLVCRYNQLASLDVSSNSALIGLFCNNNVLTSLNVNGLTSLSNINCGVNQLTNLDFSTNTGITNLGCDYNSLTSLNVKNGHNTIMSGSNFYATNNPGLSCIQVDDATWSTTNWTHKDAGASYNTSCTYTLAYSSDANGAITGTLNQTVNYGADGTEVTAVANTGYHFVNWSDASTANPRTDLNVTANITVTANFAINTFTLAYTAGANGAITGTLNQTVNYGTDGTSVTAVANTTYHFVDWSDASTANPRTDLNVTANISVTANFAINCIVNIPDINFKNALLAISGLDANSDGIIECTEATAFTGEIHAAGANIADMTGIEAFTNVTELYCGGNSFTTLNLSSNTALKRLYCGGNSLTTLNLSSNTALEYLECNDGILATLNVSGLSSLTEIYCQYNQFTTLDFSTNTGLQGLYCFNNSLTSLNVSGLTSLIEIYCYNNHLSALNVSTNTALSTLRCYSNQLTTLNVTGLSLLTNIDCSINQFSTLNFSGLGLTSLSDIYCNNNSLTTLNISGLTTLTKINCSFNQLSSLDLSSNTALQRLYCYNNTLTSLNVKNGNNTNISDFDVTNNPNLTCIQVDDAAYSTTNWTGKDAGASFSTNCTPPCIVNIPDANFKTALLANVTINTNNDGEIQCSEATAYSGTINVDTKGIADLSGIESFTNITNLICSNNSLNALNLSANSLLTYIDCTFNQLTSLDVSSNTHLTNLQCSYNSLTSLNVSGLTSLNELACNANQLANLNLSSNTALTKLDCSSNSLTSLNVSGLTLLVDLYCFNNQLTNLNVLANASIGVLECDQNLLTSLDVTGLTSLYYVTCYYNQLTTLDFSSNTSLRGLYCNDNLLTSLNVKNGNNTNFPYSDFDATYNPGLSCIQVDNAAYSTANWTQIDAGASFSTNCTPPCIVNIPDANFKAELLADVTINTNSDGEIQCSEATAYTGTIDVAVKYISDITGIEAFTNLTQLYCGGNLFTSLDLSSNTALQYLDCNEGSITSLNISGLTALTYIDCYSNQFSSLNFSGIGLSSLTNVNCADNSLTSLNVSGLTALTSLNCQYNQLSTLNVSTNTALQTLNCADNLLTSQNVSGLTALTSLDCSYNQLTGLDVSTNSALQTLNCYTNSLTSLNALGLNNLIEINVGHNQLSTLNLSGLTSLNKIDCDYNLLTSINLNGLTSLSYIECSNNQFSSLNFSGIGLTSLAYIYCSLNLLTSLNVSGLSSLYEIDCDNNQLTNLDFSSNTAIQYLYCNDNLLTSLNVKNGNNTIMSDFRATNNPNLSCIQVDNVAYSAANWTSIDAGASFSTNCQYVVSWVGGTSVNWSQGANWNTGTVPTSSDNIVISSGTTYSPIVDLNAATAAICNDLTINSGAVLTIAATKALTVNGILTNNAGTTGLVIKSDAIGTGSLINNNTNVTAKIERFFVGPNKWHFLSSPVSNQKITGSSNFIDFNNNPGNVDFYRFDPANVTTPWINIKNSAGILNTTDWGADPAFTIGAGYLTSYNYAATTKSFIGIINTTTVSPSLVASNFNLIGNPYASAIDWDLIDKTNLTAWYYIYNEAKSGGAGYEHFNTGKIAAMQGFFVECSAINSFTIPITARVHADQSFLKSTSSVQNRVMLTFSNGINWDDTQIEFIPNATSGKDWYDATKMFSMNSNIPQIYSTISTGNKFSVNTLPEISSITNVPIGIYVPANGNYTITASELNSFVATTYIYLKDLKTNSLQDMNQNASYNFTGLTTDNTERFNLIFSLSPLSIPKQNASNATIYIYNNVLYINTPENIKQLIVYNVLGEQVESINNQNLTSISLNGLPKAYYIVKVITDKNVYSEKVLVK